MSGHRAGERLSSVSASYVNEKYRLVSSGLVSAVKSNSSCGSRSMMRAAERWPTSGSSMRTLGESSSGPCGTVCGDGGSWIGESGWRYALSSTLTGRDGDEGLSASSTMIDCMMLDERDVCRPCRALRSTLTMGGWTTSSDDRDDLVSMPPWSSPSDGDDGGGVSGETRSVSRSSR